MESAVKFREGKFQNWLTVVFNWKFGIWKKICIRKRERYLCPINTVQGEEHIKF